jgi:CheY-like chemotaxis protein
MKNARPLTVCLVDDDAIYRLLTTRMIELLNPEQKVVCFSNGQQAFEYFANKYEHDAHRPDVIFLDINMPVMNGWDFLEAYEKLETTNRVPVYMVSSSLDEVDKARSKRFGMVKDYIVKPVDQLSIGRILNASLHASGCM